MATGIEHKEPGTLLQAYDNYGITNFSVWNGKRLCMVHDQGNIDAARGELEQLLTHLAAVGTGAVYVLKVHPDSVKDIKDNSPYSGSTTFCLKPYEEQTKNGVITIAPQYQGGAVSKADPALAAKLAELEKENISLRDKLHQQELKQLRQDFTNQIAGIQEQKSTEKNWGDRLMDIVENKPEVIEKTISGIGKLFSHFFKAPENYIVNNVPNPGAVSGTNGKEPVVEVDPDNINNQEDQNMETNLKFTDEGALVNPFLDNPECANKSKAEKIEFVKQCVNSLSQDNHEDIQSECLEVLAKRIGEANLTRMLLTVACLENHDLNKLLSHLD